MKDFHDRYVETEKGFKLLETISIQTDIKGFSLHTEFVSLTVDGLLTIRAGFLWNASGPTIDTKNTREATCYHDAIYVLANFGLFNGPCSQSVRKKADVLMYRMLRKNGMMWIRAKIWYRSVRMFGNSYWEKNKRRFKGMRRR
ncbi:MAG: hypothetical protein HRU26_08940 [Psychroserpens sp.]|nr:hypothetical protein [Psychroserpens sp.]